MLGGRLVGLSAWLSGPPGEPLLGLPTRLGPTLNVSLPDLGLRHLFPQQPCHREPALAHQQHPPTSRQFQTVGERPGVGRAVIADIRGSNAANDEPSSARPVSAPPSTVYAVSPAWP